MIDTILTILGVLLFLPWIIQTISTKWQKDIWHRQLLTTALTFELITMLYIPSVMYIGLGLIVLSFAIYIIRERPKLRATPFLIIAALYVLWYAISLLWSAAPNKGLKFLIDNGIVILGFASITCAVHLKEEEYTPMLLQFCYAASIFVGLCLISWGTSLIELGILPWEWPILQKTMIGDHYCYSWIFRFLGGIDGYDHPSYNLLPLFAAMPMAAWLSKRHMLRGRMWIVLWTGGVLLTILTQSRMGIIYGGIILFANSIYLLRSRQVQILASASLVVIGIWFLVFTADFWKQYSTDHARDFLQKYSWMYIQKKPWSGAGAGAVDPIEICRTVELKYWPGIGRFDPTADVAEWKPLTHMRPHNQWLADWAHAGVFAALITLAIYIAIAAKCLGRKNYWGGVFIFIFTIFSLLEPPLYVGKGLYLFCLIGILAYLTPAKK